MNKITMWILGIVGTLILFIGGCTLGAVTTADNQANNQITIPECPETNSTCETCEAVTYTGENTTCEVCEQPEECTPTIIDNTNLSMVIRLQREVKACEAEVGEYRNFSMVECSEELAECNSTLTNIRENLE